MLTLVSYFYLNDFSVKVLDFTLRIAENYCLWFPLMPSTLFRKAIIPHQTHSPKSWKTFSHFNDDDNESEYEHFVPRSAEEPPGHDALENHRGYLKNLRHEGLEIPFALSQMLTVVAQEHTNFPIVAFKFCSRPICRIPLRKAISKKTESTYWNCLNFTKSVCFIKTFLPPQ